MKFQYRDGFDFGHWLFQFIGNFVHLTALLLKIATFNLLWFDFELDWTIFSLKNSHKVTEWTSKLFNKLFRKPVYHNP